MKKTAILICLLFAFTTTAICQLKVSSNGSVSINANIQDWWSGLKVYVPTSKSCAYHLSYQNQDRFYVCAEGWLWAQQGGYFGSDVNLKQNINSIESPLTKLISLRGIQFNYRSDETKREVDMDNQNQRIGFVAQEVEKVLPGIVKVMPDSTKAVSYTDLIPLTVEAIKEQQTQIEELKEIIKQQQLQIESLKAMAESKKRKKKRK